VRLLGGYFGGIGGNISAGQGVVRVRSAAVSKSLVQQQPLSVSRFFANTWRLVCSPINALLSPPNGRSDIQPVIWRAFGWSRLPFGRGL